ncbi:unnamed protein product [Closterium sp. NIES-53]
MMGIVDYSNEEDMKYAVSQAAGWVQCGESGSWVGQAAGGSGSWVGGRGNTGGTKSVSQLKILSPSPLPHPSPSASPHQIRKLDDSEFKNPFSCGCYIRVTPPLNTSPLTSPPTSTSPSSLPCTSPRQVRKLDDSEFKNPFSLLALLTPPSHPFPPLPTPPPHTRCTS